VWDIVPRPQVAAFRDYLWNNRSKFWHKGRRVDSLPNVHDVIFDQVFMLQVGRASALGSLGSRGQPGAAGSS
jgi:hypothetical protein